MAFFLLLMLPETCAALGIAVPSDIHWLFNEFRRNTGIELNFGLFSAAQTGSLLNHILFFAVTGVLTYWSFTVFVLHFFHNKPLYVIGKAEIDCNTVKQNLPVKCFTKPNEKMSV